MRPFSEQVYLLHAWIGRDRHAGCCHGLWTRNAIDWQPGIVMSALLQSTNQFFDKIAETPWEDETECKDSRIEIGSQDWMEPKVVTDGKL